MSRPTNEPQNWVYSHIGLSENKSTNRLGVPFGQAWELSGIDGLEEGALRPFPGFTKIHTFDQLPADEHDDPATVTDVFGVDFYVGRNNSAYGFVYRVDRIDDGTSGSSGGDDGFASIYIDYYNSATDSWTYATQIKQYAPKRDSGASLKQMSVETFGKFVYIFVEGMDPICFYLGNDSPYNSFTIDPAGPGKQPTCISPGANSVTPATTTGTGDNLRPAWGQLFLVDITPRNLFVDIGDPVWKVDTGTYPASYSSITSVGSDTSSSFDDTIFVAVPNDGGQRDDDVVLLEPGDYSFAYQLYDSRTGRKSSLSEIATVRESGFFPFNDRSDALSGGAEAGTKTSLYAAMEITWDDTKFDQARIFRSVRTQDAGGTFVANILHLEAVIDLADYETDLTTSADNVRNAIYFFEKEDKQLAFQPTYQDYATFDEAMPPGGAAHIVDSTTIVSSISDPSVSTADENRIEDAIRGVGEVRWSSVFELSPELFTPGSRWLPKDPTQEILVFEDADPNIIGLSRTGLTHIRKEGNYYRFEPVHGGFGVVNHEASADVGSFVYYVGEQGMFSVDADANLDAVQAFNHIIRRSWTSTLDDVVTVFDQGMNACVVTNTTTRDQLWLWFSTSIASELNNTPFSHAFEGSWPIDYNLSPAGGTRQRRAMFLRDATTGSITKETGLEGDTTTTTLDSHPSVWVTDYRRTQVGPRMLCGVLTNQNLEISGYNTLLEVTFDIEGESPSDEELADLAGMKAVAITGDARGSRFSVSTVKYDNTSFTTPSPGTNYDLVLALDRETGSGTLAVGDRVLFSPMTTRWVGHPLYPVDEGGNMRGNMGDFARQRIVSAMQTVTSNVTELSNAGSLVTGLIYSGNSVDAPNEAKSFEVASETTEKSLQDGAAEISLAFQPSDTTFTTRGTVRGGDLVPAVSITSIDTDFYWVGTNITGHLTGEYKSGFPE